jgi:hypothetical protein
MKHSRSTSVNASAPHRGRATPSHEIPPKYLTARDAAPVYGVHRDFFRKTPELRRVRIVVSARTHLYPVAELDAFFSKRRAD